jgi:acyl-CoA synthetase (AMP-forming)/AMP-acid ligase II
MTLAIAAFIDLPHLIAQGARETPAKPALISDDGKVKCRQAFDWCASRIAASLVTFEPGRGDKVAVLAPPSVGTYELFIGALRVGAYVVPLSTMASTATLEKMLIDSEAKLIALSDVRRPLIEPFAERLRHLQPIAFDLRTAEWLDFEAWLAAAPEAPPKVTIRPEDPFKIIYSSGTTGAPKGIVHGHALRFGHVRGLEAFGIAADAVALVSTPLYSNTSLVARLPTLGHGGTAVIINKFNTHRFLQLADAHKVTHAMLVPVQYQRVLGDPDFDHYDLSNFKMKITARAPLRREIKQAILERWPGELAEIYGLTEGGGSTVLDASAHPDKLNTVGLPLTTVQMKMIDEAGRELPQGAIGKIVGHADNMMAGYYKRPDQTVEIFSRNKDGSLFFCSDDLGRFDENSFLVLPDRKKDAITSGGSNACRADIDAALFSHPGVADVAVIAAPSKRWGKTPLALVVPKATTRILPDQLCGWSNARLGKTQRLSTAEFRDALPRSPIGKILKRELRPRYWQTVGHSA